MEIANEDPFVLSFEDETGHVLAVVCRGCRDVVFVKTPEFAVESALHHGSVCPSDDIAIMEMLAPIASAEN